MHTHTHKALCYSNVRSASLKKKKEMQRSKKGFTLLKPLPPTLSLLLSKGEGEIWGQDRSAQLRPWPAQPIHQGYLSVRVCACGRVEKRQSEWSTDG